MFITQQAGINSASATGSATTTSTSLTAQYIHDSIMRSNEQNSYFATIAPATNMLMSTSTCFQPSQTIVNVAASVPPPPLANNNTIRVFLEEKDLWSRFYQVTNEMILTKAGRRTFPLIKMRMHGLDETELYTVQIEFRLADQFKYRFVNGEWKTSPRNDTSTAFGGGGTGGGSGSGGGGLQHRMMHQQQQQPIIHQHSDSPNFGHHWMKDVVVFGKLKLTNNENTKNADAVYLKSLMKYEPVIHVYKHEKKNVDKRELVYSKAFVETQFIAVTAYQNEQITTLKIKHNPFAKAFLNNKPTITIDSDRKVIISDTSVDLKPFNLDHHQQPCRIQNKAIPHHSHHSHLNTAAHHHHFLPSSTTTTTSNVGGYSPILPSTPKLECTARQAPPPPHSAAAVVAAAAAHNLYNYYQMAASVSSNPASSYLGTVATPTAANSAAYSTNNVYHHAGGPPGTIGGVDPYTSYQYNRFLTAPPTSTTYYHHHHQASVDPIYASSIMFDYQQQHQQQQHQQTHEEDFSSLSQQQQQTVSHKRTLRELDASERPPSKRANLATVPSCIPSPLYDNNNVAPTSDQQQSEDDSLTSSSSSTSSNGDNFPSSSTDPLQQSAVSSPSFAMSSSIVSSS